MMRLGVVMSNTTTSSRCAPELHYVSAGLIAYDEAWCSDVQYASLFKSLKKQTIHKINYEFVLQTLLFQ